MSKRTIEISDETLGFAMNAIQGYYRSLFVENFHRLHETFPEGHGALAFARRNHEKYLELMGAFGAPNLMPDGHPGINKLYKRFVRGQVTIKDAAPLMEKMLKEIYE